MSEKQFKIVGLGEVLWDLLPTGKQIGGAPANFAFIAAQLGDDGIVASRIGNDRAGAEITNRLQVLGVKTNNIQIDQTHPTGAVNVSLENGQPQYLIVESVAWDFLELSEDWRVLATDCDAVCFGSLAQRNAVSRQTIRLFLQTIKPTALCIFDVNLRQSFYSAEILRESFKLANVVKLNHEELPTVADVLGIEGNDEIERARNLLLSFGVRVMCLTRGANGSLLITENEISEHAGIEIKVADAIGAGDAFTATLAHGLLRDWTLAKINAEANKIGAFVASQTGAMPSLKKSEMTF